MCNHSKNTTIKWDGCDGLEVSNTVGEGKAAVTITGKGRDYDGRSIIDPRQRCHDGII